MATKLCVLFGGKSSEHEVSCMSAYNILKNLDKEKYDIIKFGITKTGATWLYTGDDESIKDGTWEHHDCTACVISHCPKTEGLIKLLPDGTYEKIKVDVFFPVLHGKNGEDGTIQGVFELAQIPYVGNEVLGSALCMDKIFTKVVLESAGIATSPGFYITKSENNEEKVNEKIMESIGYPVVVKPSNAGSSIGVSLVEERAELKSALDVAFLEDRRVLIEKKIDKREVECAVLGDHETAVASVIGEVITLAKMYDYTTKYQDSATKTQIPAEVDEELSDELRELAVRAFLACDCTGLARVDFFVENESNKIYLNEINTLPGFTNISMYPMLWGATGIKYSDLLDRVIELAKAKKE